MELLSREVPLQVMLVFDLPSRTCSVTINLWYSPTFPNLVVRHKEAASFSESTKRDAAQ